MKITGIAVLMIGIMIMLFSGSVLLFGQDNAQFHKVIRSDVDRDLGFLFAFGFFSASVGASLSWYGGRGYFFANNPAIRN